MPEKDPSNYSLITYLWVAGLASWGGVVNFISKVRAGNARAFNLMELMGEIVTSALVGIITFWLCEWSNIDPLLSAALIAVSGHMGSRAMFQFERWAETKLGQRMRDCPVPEDKELPENCPGRKD